MSKKQRYDTTEETLATLKTELGTYSWLDVVLVYNKSKESKNQKLEAEMDLESFSRAKAYLFKKVYSPGRMHLIDLKPMFYLLDKYANLMEQSARDKHRCKANRVFWEIVKKGSHVKHTCRYVGRIKRDSIIDRRYGVVTSVTGNSLSYSYGDGRSGHYERNEPGEKMEFDPDYDPLTNKKLSSIGS